MSGSRSKQRTAQHEAMFPPGEKQRERRRLAQARYRKAHAKRLATARQITSILRRQSWHAGDIERLAVGLRTLLTPEGIKELRTELGRRQRRTR